MDIGESAQLALERGTHYPHPGEVYRHYNGVEVEVHCVSINEADMDVLVTYHELNTGHLWTHTFASWNGHVTSGDHLASEVNRRFTRV